MVFSSITRTLIVVAIPPKNHQIISFHLFHYLFRAFSRIAQLFYVFNRVSVMTLFDICDYLINVRRNTTRALCATRVYQPDNFAVCVVLVQSLEVKCLISVVFKLFSSIVNHDSIVTCLLL